MLPLTKALRPPRWRAVRSLTARSVGLFPATRRRPAGGPGAVWRLGGEEGAYLPESMVSSRVSVSSSRSGVRENVMTAPSSPSELGAAPAGRRRQPRRRAKAPCRRSSPGRRPASLAATRASGARARNGSRQLLWPSCAVSGPREADGRTPVSPTREARAGSRPRTGEQCRRRRCGSPAASLPSGRR